MAKKEITCRRDLENLTIAELIELAQTNKSTKRPFKKALVDHLEHVLGVNEEKLLFEAIAGNYGLKPSDYGRTFIDGKHSYSITGINPGRRANPLTVTRDDGKVYRCPAGYVLDKL